ncbi:MAG: hypothetical protein ACR2FU_06335 [Streptosporangiaceae bacterium]
MTTSPGAPGPGHDRDAALKPGPVPAGGALIPALPRRQVPASHPAGIRPPKWAPPDPEILARVRAGLDRL